MLVTLQWQLPLHLLVAGPWQLPNDLTMVVTAAGASLESAVAMAAAPQPYSAGQWQPPLHLAAPVNGQLALYLTVLVNGSCTFTLHYLLHGSWLMTFWCR